MQEIKFCPLLILGKMIFPRFMINREVKTFSNRVLPRTIIEDTQHRGPEEGEAAQDIQDSHKKKLLAQDRPSFRDNTRCRMKDNSISV